MGQIKGYLVLLFVFGLVFSARLGFNAYPEYFSDSESYYIMRQVENIRGHLLPIFEDKLSYEGKNPPALPVYNYLMAGASLLGDFFAFKLLPALFATGLAIAVYLTALEIVRKTTIAAVSAFFAGFIPILVGLTTNSLTKYNLTLLIFILSIYYLLKLEKTKTALPWLILTSAMLTMLSSFAVVFVLAVWLYMGMLNIQGIKLQPKTFEFMLFITFLVLVVNNLALLQVGIHNGIQSILASFHASPSFGYGINWGSLLSGINVVVLLLGIWGAYMALTKDTKKREAALFISIVLAVMLLGLVGFLEMGIILGTIGITLSITSIYAIDFILEYIGKLKLAANRHLLLIAFFIVLLAPVALSGVYEGLIKADSHVKGVDVAALLWLKENSGKPSTVIAPIEYGHLISYFAKKKNVIDTNIINFAEAEQRLKDIQTVYTSPFETDALKIFEKYDVNFILINPAIAAQFKIKKLSYVNDANCFTLLYNKTMEIYEVKCGLG